jgi:hypothetical protein
MAKRKSDEKTPDVVELITRYLRAREAGKRAYQRADRLMQQIATQAEPGEEVPLNDVGRKAVLTDRFADALGKGVIWTPCAARRWDLEIIEP